MTYEIRADAGHIVSEIIAESLPMEHTTLMHARSKIDLLNLESKSCPRKAKGDQIKSKNLDLKLDL